MMNQTRFLSSFLRVLCVLCGSIFFAGCPQPEDSIPEIRTPFDPDLYGWRTASWSPFTTSDSLRGFACGGGVYVAVTSTGKIAWSHNGDIWEIAYIYDTADPPALTPPYWASWNAVAYGNGTFAVVGNDGKAAYSADGRTWAAIANTGFGSAHINGIAWGEIDGIAYFAAVGQNANITYSIDNAKTWAGGSAAGFTNITLNDIVYGGGYFYAVGDSGYTGYSDTPANLNGWHPYRYGAPFNGNNIKKIAFGKYGSEAGLGLVFEEWGGKRLALGAVEKFWNHDANVWDADVDAGSFGNNYIGGIAWGGG